MSFIGEARALGPACLKHTLRRRGGPINVSFMYII